MNQRKLLREKEGRKFSKCVNENLKLKREEDFCNEDFCNLPPSAIRPKPLNRFILYSKKLAQFENKKTVSSS